MKHVLLTVVLSIHLLICDQRCCQLHSPVSLHFMCTYGRIIIQMSKLSLR